jgi:hypothetical protein
MEAQVKERASSSVVLDNPAPQHKLSLGLLGGFDWGPESDTSRWQRSECLCSSPSKHCAGPVDAFHSSSG